MRLAVVSDIHGNYKALEAFLEYLEVKKADFLICLGDYVTDGPYPKRTIKLLHEMAEKYPCVMMRGNREQYLIDNARSPKGWHISSANGSLFYTSQQVTAGDLAFFESLPCVKALEQKECPPTLLCHGSPEDLRGNVLEEKGLKERLLKELSEDYLLGGHSHHQEIYTQSGKTYLNPGSLGLAIDGVGRRAQFAMLTTDKVADRTVYKQKLCSIPYDVDGYLKDFKEAGLDEYGLVLNRAVKKTLVTGVNYFFNAVVEAVKLSGKPLPDISEAVWKEVAEKLEIE